MLYPSLSRYRKPSIAGRYNLPPPSSVNVPSISIAKLLINPTRTINRGGILEYKCNVKNVYYDKMKMIDKNSVVYIFLGICIYSRPLTQARLQRKEYRFIGTGCL